MFTEGTVPWKLRSDQVTLLEKLTGIEEALIKTSGILAIPQFWSTGVCLNPAGPMAPLWDLGDNAPEVQPGFQYSAKMLSS